MSYNNGRRPTFRERVAKFMYGRYGIDELYHLILTVCLILMVINVFVKSYIISAIEILLFIYLIFRTMSKNIYKRQKENAVFLKVRGKIVGWFKFQNKKWQCRKTHKFRKCPKCKNNLRVPRVKGRHIVACPCCNNRFETRI